MPVVRKTSPDVLVWSLNSLTASTPNPRPTPSASSEMATASLTIKRPFRDSRNLGYFFRGVSAVRMPENACKSATLRILAEGIQATFTVASASFSGIR